MYLSIRPVSQQFYFILLLGFMFLNNQLNVRSDSIKIINKRSENTNSFILKGKVILSKLNYSEILSFYSLIIVVR